MRKFIKVDPKVKPIHYTKRKRFELFLNESYYVSFGGNKVEICKLREIDNTDGKDFISIEIISSSPTTSHTLRSDEIGRTPEEAVINTVTS